MATGAQYAWGKQWKFDVGFAYEFLSDMSSNQNAGDTAAYGLIKGNYTGGVWIVGGQVAYNF